MTHLGVHAGGGYDAPAPPPGDHSGGGHHIDPLGQWGVLRERAGGLLGHGGGLAGEGALVGLQPRRLQNAAVGGHQIPCFQPDHISRHQRLGVQPHLSAAPDYPGLGSGHLPQSVQSPLGAVLLGQGNAGIYRHNAQNDGRVQPVLPAAGPQGQPRRPQQYQNHGVLQLPQQPQQQALFSGLFQPVGSVPLQTDLRLLPAQPPLPVALQRRQNLSRALPMPVGHGSSLLVHPVFSCGQV